MLTNHVIYYNAAVTLLIFSANSQHRDPIEDRAIEPCLSFTAYNTKEKTFLDCWLSCDALCSKLLGYYNPQRRPVCYEKEVKSEYQIENNDTCSCGRYFARGSESLWKACNPPVRYDTSDERLCGKYCARLFAYTYEYRQVAHIGQCSFVRHSTNATPLRGACSVGERNEFECRCGLPPLVNVSPEKLVERQTRLQTPSPRVERSSLEIGGTVTNERTPGAKNFVEARKNVEIDVGSAGEFNSNVEVAKCDKSGGSNSATPVNNDAVATERVRLLRNANGSITDDLSMFRECRHVSQSMHLADVTLMRCLHVCSNHCATLRAFEDANQNVVCFDRTAPVKAAYQANIQKCDCQVIHNRESSPITCNDRISRYRVSEGRCKNKCNSLTGFTLSRKGNPDIIVTGCASKRDISTQRVVAVCERRNESNAKCSCGIRSINPVSKATDSFSATFIVRNQGRESPSETTPTFPNSSQLRNSPSETTTIIPKSSRLRRSPSEETPTFPKSSPLRKLPSKTTPTISNSSPLRKNLYAERNNSVLKKREKGSSRDFKNDLRANKSDTFNKGHRESKKKNAEKLRAMDKFSSGESKNSERDSPSVSESFNSHKERSTSEASIDKCKNLREEKYDNSRENSSSNNPTKIISKNLKLSDGASCSASEDGKPQIDSPSVSNRTSFASRNDAKVRNSSRETTDQFKRHSLSNKNSPKILAITASPEITKNFAVNKSSHDLGIYTRPSTFKNSEIVYCNAVRLQTRPKENATKYGSSRVSESPDKIRSNSTAVRTNLRDNLSDNRQVFLQNCTPATVKPTRNSECSRGREGSNSCVSRNDLNKPKYKEKIPDLSISVVKNNPLIAKSMGKGSASVGSPVKRKMILQPLSDEETENAEKMTKTDNDTELQTSKIDNIEMRPKRFKSILASANEEELNASKPIAEKTNAISEKVNAIPEKNNFKRTLSRTDILRSDEQSVAKKTNSPKSDKNKQIFQKSASFSAIESNAEKFARRREKFASALEALKAQSTHPRKCRTPRSKAAQISAPECSIRNMENTGSESPIVTLPYNDEEGFKVTIDEVVWKSIDEIDFCDETQWREIIGALAL